MAKKKQSKISIVPAKAKKPKIINLAMQDLLKKLPDLIYAEDLTTITPGNLLAIMNALDDAADYINDYLTDNNLGQSYTYPDMPKIEH